MEIPVSKDRNSNWMLKATMAAGMFLVGRTAFYVQCNQFAASMWLRELRDWNKLRPSPVSYHVAEAYSCVMKRHFLQEAKSGISTVSCTKRRGGHDSSNIDCGPQQFFGA